ncbi:MAG TPA: phosphotransferase [Steroidobacteraceae bacterium]|jgi:aminoglycoside/choline kinase family phosphotransferase|nr:phosphotransferase [Steroidobacteraceae bacterium]
MTTNDNADTRLQALERWIAGLPGPPVERIAPASADASFRRYFRVHRAGATQVAMDAPPERESLDAWLRVVRILAATGVHVPEVVAVDTEQGFVLMADLGRQHYLEAIGQGADPEPLYADAVDALVRMQSGDPAEAAELPEYDRELLMRELELFPEWFLGRHLSLSPGPPERAMIASAFDFLCDEALAQPVVLVHRDYHSRNLLVRRDGNPGIVDFQDAVRGAITYDLVSLLKDCYVVWPKKRLLAWLDRYREKAAAAGLDAGRDRGQFLRWFDRMGLQRHLKVLGIFARLWHRDGKPGYLGDLPRVLDYTLEVTAAVPELAGFDAYLRRAVVPAFRQVHRRAGTAR